MTSAVEMGSSGLVCGGIDGRKYAGRCCETCLCGVVVVPSVGRRDETNLRTLSSGHEMVHILASRHT